MCSGNCTCSKWQPMETAPRDGTTFLAYYPDSREIDIPYYSDGSWYSSIGHYVKAFVWQPLPEPPKEEE